MGGRTRAAALLLAAALAGGAAELPAQEVDSLAALRRARTLQASFERYRYQHLPRSVGSVSGPCTERIGRWCFWFSPGSADRLPEEPGAVVERRGELIGRLARMADEVPGEPWIVGQLVRYLVEGGDLEGAVAVAHGCRAAGWWCRALEGYAYHSGGRYADAERAYGAALGAMPEAERERWTDPTLLLRPGDRRALRRMDPAARARVERALWWLADPLWSDEGNDRLTEHYARWTMALLQERARQADRTSWGEDTREMLLRYGGTVAWERIDAPVYFGGGGDGGVIGHTDDRSWEWLVPLEMALDPSAVRGDAWPLAEEEPTATRYAPAYAGRVLPLDVQLARFRRPSGPVLVAGYALRADSLPADARLRVRAVAAAGPGGPRSTSRWDPTAPAGALYLELPTAAGAVVSVEVMEDSARLLARRREAVAPTADPRISDILLLAHPDARPTELEEAARIARGSATARAGERVAVFWEMYGIPATDSLTLRVGLLAPRAGWVRRRLQAIGIAGARRPVRLRVREETEGGGTVGRSLAIALPPGLAPGEYALEITARAPGYPPATTRRGLTITR